MQISRESERERETERGGEVFITAMGDFLQNKKAFHFDMESKLQQA